ncbi:hypothetical protein DPMN_082861 [Dreissena polymorpha]|uniref:Uncharacterized protein n=1 Tax=Dreissena polymorpha TaxID=45954 RepID=A0A9D3YBJ0_DREPO|nr:hypothetical protein DPMN_082861 [Dreissena polymorpha]
MQNLHDLAMFRFNFWHKPFLSPPAAHQPFPTGMDSFIPNPMGSPALMVLASTAENHEGSRLNGTPRFTNPDSKEGSPQFTTPNFTMYRPGEHFPSPIYAPVHPLVRAGVRSDRSGVGIMHPAGSSAFRHVSGENTLDQFHSAFSPAKRPKPEDLSKKSHTASNDSNHNHNESICEDRPSSQSSVNYETNSDSYSEHGDRGTPDSEGRSLRSKSKDHLNICFQLILKKCLLSKM